MTYHDVIVVGAGLFGQIIAAKLRSLSMDVIVLDARKRGAGSIPAACLIKPSWLSSISKEDFDLSLETLNQLYGVQTIRILFRSKPLSKKINIYWVPPSLILNENFVECEVMSVYLDRVETNLGTIRAKHVIVAAGIWTKDLVSSAPEIVGKAGVAFIWKNNQISKPFIKLWAPYKHLVVFNIAKDKIWAGDGRTILAQNWRDYHTGESLFRCSQTAKLPIKEAEPIFGIRPYVKCNGPCYLENHDGIWIATGGAKNGTVAAAWAANKLVEKVT